MKLHRTLCILGLVSLGFTVKPATAQNDGLKTNSAYISLLENEKTLSSRQDSIQTAISQKRQQLQKDPDNRSKYATEITDMESQLFDIRAKLGTITTQLNTLEQEYILKNMNQESAQGAGDGSVATQHKYLLANKFMKENISKDEMNVINMPPLKAQRIEELGNAYNRLYEVKAQLAQQYKNAGDKTAADSIRGLWDANTEQQKQLEAELEEIWRPVYSLKYDVYRRLLDKISAPANLIENLNEKSRTVRSEESHAAGLYNSATFAMYPLQKRLTMEYESALAGQLGLTQAKDSLAKAIANFNSELYSQDPVALSQMIFVNFVPVTIGGNQVHDAENPIPKLTIPSKGSLFKVEMATYAKEPTTYTVFKKVYPLEYTILPDEKYRYYAGSFDNREEAAKAAARLKQYGFKTRVVEWKDGYELDENGQPIIPVVISDAYRVVFPEMTEQIRQTLTGVDKELSKLDVDGVTMYSVGLFDERAQAEEVAGKIGASARIIGVDLDN